MNGSNPIDDLDGKIAHLEALYQSGVGFTMNGNRQVKVEKGEELRARIASLKAQQTGKSRVQRINVTIEAPY